MTEEQEREAGERLAEIFCLKRSPDFPDRWVMGEGYFDKTSLGVFRVFKDVAKQLLPAYKAAPKMLEALKVLVNHAQETYPHFERPRGQDDIQRGLDALNAANPKWNAEEGGQS